MTSNSRIHSSIDLELDGEQSGYLRLPYSSHESAYGWLPIPIAVVRHGDGPTVLLLGGVHGDEYEGQVALAKLMRELRAEQVRGRVIMLPSTNLPAVEAHNRLSPLDKGNLNRAFPGDPNGTPTQMIGHYLEEVLLPQCDYVVDLHSGGSSLEYVPCVRARLSPDPGIARETVALVEAFDAHFGVLFRPAKGEPRTMSAACERKGVVYINPETGGGGWIDRAALSIAEDGVRRCLAHIGVIPRELAPPIGKRNRFATLDAANSLVYSEWAGLFEPLVSLRDHVDAGQPVAAVHDPMRPWQQPQVISARIAGTVLCRRVPGWVAVGDCLFEVGVDFSPNA